MFIMYQLPVPVYSVPYTLLTRNYICGHIYQDCINTKYYYILFYHFNNS